MIESLLIIVMVLGLVVTVAAVVELASHVLVMRRMRSKLLGSIRTVGYPRLHLTLIRMPSGEKLIVQPLPKAVAKINVKN